MPIQPAAAPQRNRVVVALLSGERLKGYVYDFSPLKDAFTLSPADGPLAARGTRVELRDVKAVFFVNDFGGDPGHKPNTSEAAPLHHGRKLEVTFADGEKIVGTTEAYSPQKPGFFMIPADSETNNLRVFVVNQNVRGLRFL